MALIDPATAAQLVKRFESGGGDYGAKNPHSTASGAYQFVDSTWRNYANQMGIDTNQFPTAMSAPAPVQDAVFQHAVKTRGLGDWTCPGCNPALVGYLNTHGMGGPVAFGPNNMGTGTGTPSPGQEPGASTTDLAGVFTDHLRNLQSQQANLAASPMPRAKQMAFGMKDPLVGGLEQVAAAFQSPGA